MRSGTMFSGGGLVDIGMMQAGWVPAWAIEYDPKIAAVYRQNVGDHILVADVCNVDYTDLSAVDWLHASTSCIHASRANANAGETEGDIQCAAAVVRAIKTHQPPFFTLENVWTYRNFQSFKLILNALVEEGYFYDFKHLNMANYGVPQNRWRLFLLASRGLLPFIPTSKPGGWKAAIEDLIPGLKESAFPEWQLRRLEGKWLPEFIINGANANSEYSFPVIPPSEPVFTMTANFGKISNRMLLSGRTLAASPRCYARWQTIPDSYTLLPTNKALACRIIGNGVPCEFIRRVGEALRGAL